MLCYVWLLLKEGSHAESKREGKCLLYLFGCSLISHPFSLKTRKKGVAMFHKNTPLKRPKITLGVFQLVERDDASSYFQPPIKKFYARFFALNKWWGKASNVLNINPWRILKCNPMHNFWKYLKMSHFSFSIFLQFLAY